ncbi:MAG: RNase adapter RapZ [Deltaproteobacteria bacterium]|nr:RNase adapter RapZ [Deltaproteobacteria bacterium]MBW2070511.1 RNase adapter RapZ [Deltaproteobacteria bacterium]
MIVIVTGLSGSGKSTAIKAFEDLGFFCVDNLPVLLLPDFLALRQQGSEDLRYIALGMDIRERRFLESYPQIFSELYQKGAHLEILFLEASNEVLQRRFSQTRRRHPLAGIDTVLEGIEAERRLLLDLKRMATRVLDTSNTSVHELKRLVSRLYSFRPDLEGLHVHLLSFGFKYGVPPEADIVMDVRFLPNPFFVDDLRDLDGTGQPVIEFVCSREKSQVFLQRFTDLLFYLLPHYQEEGKNYLTIAIGCTGGKHRSVVIAGELAQRLAAEGYKVDVNHRDMKVEL